MTQETVEWLDSQVNEFRALRPVLLEFREFLEDFLTDSSRRISAQAIVQVRVKQVASFAEKALRKQGTRPDPVRQFTDLCGARIVVRSRVELRKLHALIREVFSIDWENSLDAHDQLRSDEFGYRSAHLIVMLRHDVDYGCPLAPGWLGIRTEIQLRTIAEHAYSEFGHDLGYKGPFGLPYEIGRELAAAAAALEEVDGTFERIEAQLAEYDAHFGSYLDAEHVRAEMELIGVVLAHDPTNRELAVRLARLALIADEPERAVRTLSPLRPAAEAVGDVATLTCLGAALCDLHGGDQTSAEFSTGLRLLEAAAEAGDTEALCRIGAVLRGVDDVAALAAYRRAFEQDPTDPETLGGFLALELRSHPRLAEALTPLIGQAMRRAERQVAAGVNLPFVHFSLARFRLLAGVPYRAMHDLCDGIALSQSAAVLRDCLADLRSLGSSRPDLPGIAWALRAVTIALAAKFADPAATSQLCALRGDRNEVDRPVLIVSGMAAASQQEQVNRLRPFVEAALRDAEGTVICGGTAQGIPGMVGDCLESRQSVSLLGYRPATLPASVSPHPAYVARVTAADEFSNLEPLQLWTDLVAAGVDPRTVTVLGFGGERISAFEYRFARALGAVVGLASSTLGAVGVLLGEEPTARRGMIQLPLDPEVLRAFVATPGGEWNAGLREQLAESIHENYRAGRVTEPSADPALAEWAELDRALQASNRAQADAIESKLNRIGYRLTPSQPGGPLPALSTAEIEELAEAEHGRWTAERLRSGWVWGPERDNAAKRNPSLVAWHELTEEVKDLDRQAVRQIPEVLAGAGLTFEPVSHGRVSEPVDDQ